MNQKEMAMTLSFRQEDDGTWSIQSNLDNDADADGFVPITKLPLDVLKIITSMPGEPPLPPELKKALDDQLTAVNKKLTEEADAVVRDAVALGDGAYLIDGVVNQYFPTINISPENVDTGVMIGFDYAKDPMFGWMGRLEDKEEHGETISFVPLSEMPLSALKAMSLLTPNEPLPPDLVAEIEHQIESKELAAKRKAEENEAFAEQAKSLGYNVIISQEKE